MKDYVVVDVRDDDWEGGNIKGAVNHPSYGFLARVDELVKQTKDVPLVIFHCALSEVRCASLSRRLYFYDASDMPRRGPKAARVSSSTASIPST